MARGKGFISTDYMPFDPLKLPTEDHIAVGGASGVADAGARRRFKMSPQVSYLMRLNRLLNAEECVSSLRIKSAARQVTRAQKSGNINWY